MITQLKFLLLFVVLILMSVDGFLRPDGRGGVGHIVDQYHPNHP